MIRNAAPGEHAAPRGFDMKAQGDSAEILIYGDIGCGPWDESGVDAKKFAEELNKLNGVKEITVRLNSPGGYVSHGIAIYNSLKQHKAKITVQIDAMAISIATIIAMAGDTVTMAANGLFMIHDPSALCIGTSEDMRKEADVMDKMKTLMVETYAKRAKLTPDELSAAMKAETWYTAAEAMAAGFVDSITAASGATAHFDPQKYHYRNIPVDNMTLTFKSIEKMEAYLDKFPDDGPEKPEIPARIISLENYRRKLEIAEFA